MKGNLISLNGKNSKALNNIQSQYSNKNAEITHRKIYEEKTDASNGNILSNLKIILKRSTNTSKSEAELNTSTYTKQMEKALSYSSSPVNTTPSTTTEMTTSSSNTSISELHLTSTSPITLDNKFDENLRNTLDLDYLNDPLDLMEDEKHENEFLQILQNNLTLTELLQKILGKNLINYIAEM